jgi:2-polyprenyl-3-methyl-5-hydroxy-6-metoxy-1,4-benzoquinol methylase/spore coat polysaccharide biosynthesis predicted glycosyltransferase SpsG
VKLVQELRSRGREAWLYLPPGSEKAGRIVEAAHFDRSWITANTAFCTEAGWEWIVLDHYKTPHNDFSRWEKIAPLIGIDEGGPCRNRFDFLIDILPNLYNRYPKAQRELTENTHWKNHANISAPSLLPLPKKPQTRRSAPNAPLKVLVSFGQEDSARLGPAVADALAAKSSAGLIEIILLGGRKGSGEWGVGNREQGTGNREQGTGNRVDVSKHNALPTPTDCKQQPQGGRAAPLLPTPHSPLPNLNEHLHEYGLVITHYGITAFEALYAGVPVLLLSPGAYHEKLARAAGFFSVGIGRGNAARLARLLFKKNAFNVSFLRGLGERCAALAARYKLDSEPGQSLAALIDGMSPLVCRKCPACGLVLNGDIVMRHSERSYRRCPACGLISMSRYSPPPIEYGREYFFDLYKKQYGKTYIEDFPNLVNMARRRIAVIKKLMGQVANNVPHILDIGCAYGPFLAAAKEAGFSPLGIDPAEDAVRYVTETLAIPAIQGHFPDCLNQQLSSSSPTPHSPLPIPQFDTVTLWFVIEHFQDCAMALAEIRKILKPGGTLAFATPSFSGISGRASLARFLKQSPADHWTVWSPRICKKALKTQGFDVKKIVVSGHHPERFPIIGKYAHNKKKLLCSVLMAISRMFSLGDTFEVYAKKTHA